MAQRDDLMNEIGERLGLPPAAKGVGSSVHNDFIEPLAAKVLGADLASRFPDKYRKVQAIVEALGGTYVPGSPHLRGAGHTSEGTSSGGGGTLTNLGLVTIRDLLLTNGVPVLQPSPNEPMSAIEGIYDPSAVVDARVRQLREVSTRPGATGFREKVRDAYGRRCCISGADELAALDVAHIAPYSGPASDVVENSLLLRADLHKLHDALLLAVSDEDLTVLVKPRLLGTVYADFAGSQISAPVGHHLSRESLRLQRERCGL